MFYGTLSQASIEIVIASQREAIQNSARNQTGLLRRVRSSQ
jgi:hypothetical protein